MQSLVACSACSARSMSQERVYPAGSNAADGQQQCEAGPEKLDSAVPVTGG
jgi:hypothetical protein